MIDDHPTRTMTGGRFADCRSSRLRLGKGWHMFAGDEGGESRGPFVRVQ
jgi:hypothetical protein